MFLNPRYNRRSIRLKGFDYTVSGAYFITICTYERECWLGDVIDETFHPSQYGDVVDVAWKDLPSHYSTIELDAFVVMPNHVHGIILLGDSVGAGFKPAPTGVKRLPLSEVVRGFKTFSARRVIELRSTPGNRVWQRIYYEHIIRDEASLNPIRQYIISNPEQWALDHENPTQQRLRARSFKTEA